MGTAIERTAKADFKVGDDGIKVDDEARTRGFLVKAGQIVEIPSKARLKKLVDAGLVAATDDEDADVPKLPKAAAVVVADHKAAAQAKRAAATQARDHANKMQAELDALKAKGTADTAAIAAAEAAVADATTAAEAAEKEAESAEAAASA